MRIQRNISLKPYTRFQIAGAAAYFIEVKNSRELVQAVRIAKEKGLPYYILAGGSNTAFADGTLPGAVIRLKEITRPAAHVVIHGAKVRVAANVQLWKFVKLLIRHSLGGLERLSGVPGSVGGAIVGNAGAYGGEISRYLTRVRIYDGKSVRWISKEACGFVYRHSNFKEYPWLVLEAEFKFVRSAQTELQKIADEIIVKRGNFMLDFRTPGSFFKNVFLKDVPESSRQLIDLSRVIEGKVPTAYLLDQIGSKGTRYGGIEVSDWHANVFINDGSGTYQDLHNLTTELKRRVKETFDIDLQEEVRRVGIESFVQP